MESDLLETFELESRCLIKSSSRIFAKEYVEDGVPFFRSKDVIDKALGVFSGYDLFISRERYEELKKSHGSPSKGDLLISSVGNRSGQPYVVQDEGDFYFKDGNIIWISNFKDIDSNFLAYWFKSNIGQSRLASVMIGSAQKALTINSIRTLTVTFPIFANQKAIAHILGSLDDKIELNRQMNETLEAMAQALFKSWFVDFDPVIDNALAAGTAIPDEFAECAEQRKGIEKKDNTDIQSLFPDEFEFTEEMGWIPKGWGVKSLDEVADYLNGLALQKYRPEDIDDNYLPIVKIAQLREGLPNHDEKASINIKPEYIIDNGDVIFSWSGSLLVDVWCGGKAALNQHLFKVTSDKYPKWFYLNYTKHHLVEFQRIATDKAVTMGHIKRGHLKEALCVIPENGVDDNIFAVFEGILNKQIRLRIESQTLAKLRDTLLPKLMSGELRIPDAAELVGEAII